MPCSPQTPPSQHGLPTDTNCWKSHTVWMLWKILGLCFSPSPQWWAHPDGTSTKAKFTFIQPGFSHRHWKERGSSRSLIESSSLGWTFLSFCWSRKTSSCCWFFTLVNTVLDAVQLRFKTHPHIFSNASNAKCFSFSRLWKLQDIHYSKTKTSTVNANACLLILLLYSMHVIGTSKVRGTKMAAGANHSVLSAPLEFCEGEHKFCFSRAARYQKFKIIFQQLPDLFHGQAKDLPGPYRQQLPCLHNSQSTVHYPQWMKCVSPAESHTAELGFCADKQGDDLLLKVRYRALMPWPISQILMTRLFWLSFLEHF